MKKRFVYYFTLAVFSLLFYFLLYTYTGSSDYLLYSYKFSLSPQKDAPWPLIHEKIASLWDILYSQFVHYFYVNGRSVVHAFVQLFTTMRYDVCCVLGTIVFAITLLLAEKVCFKRTVQAWTPRYVLILGVFVFCCAPSTIYSMVTTINYLWPLTLCLLFIILLNKPLNVWQKCLFFIVALMTGWSHEAIAIPVSSAFFVYLLIERKTIKPYQVIGIILLFMGTTATVVAPGNFYKFTVSHGTQYSGVLPIIKHHLAMIKYLRLTYVLFIILILLAIKKELFSFVSRYKYWFIALASSIAFILLVGAINPRSTFFIEMIAGGLLCIYVDENLKPLTQRRLILVVALISIPLFVATSYYRSMIKENVTKTNLLLASSPNKVVKINVPRVNVPYVLSPYIGATQGKNEVHLTWQNTVYEFVYEKEKVNINYFDVE